MFELSFHHVKKYMDAHLVLKDITFNVYEGDKVGIVGANGSGKSTILKLIAGILKLNCFPGSKSRGYDEGSISMPSGATTAYLEQIPQYPQELTVLDVLHLAFEEAHRIEKEMRELEIHMQALEGNGLDRALKQYGQLQQLYEAKGGYEIGEKLNKVCKGLKFEDSFLNKDFSLLSGGEKTKVILGKLLIDQPDILLLDEPTNHLDMDSIEWLEEILQSYKGIVMIVSHDRYFLDNVVSKIIEIEDMENETYIGNYSAYVKEKEERMLIQFENFREQQKQINAMEKAIKDLRDWAQRADNNKFFRRAASMQKRLENIERVDKPIFDRKNMKLNFKATERSGMETIKAVEISKSYGEKAIFKNANLMVQYGERVALIGPNGSGKTTFLKMLIGEEHPDAGVVELGANVKAAYLPQNIVFKDEEATLLDCFREDVLLPEGKSREYLSKYMFYGGTVFKKVKHLSGGERIRLKLSQLLYEDINLLILDEPTNHLDIDSIETFEEALEEFTGTIFFISHDRYFINKLGERVVAIEDFGFRTYLGNYDYYRSVKGALSEAPPKEIDARPVKMKKPRDVNEDRKLEAEKERLEERIATLENEIKELDITMADSELEYEELYRLYSKKDALVKELDALMEQWLSM